jgi:hypothetical protein
MGLSMSDMRSLKEDNIFSGKSTDPSYKSTPKRYRIQNKGKYMKHIIQQTSKAEKSLNISTKDLSRTALF